MTSDKQHGGERSGAGFRKKPHPYKKDLPFAAYLTPEGAAIIKKITDRNRASLKSNSQILDYAIKKAFYD